MAPGLVAVGAPTLRAIRATTPTPPTPRLAIAHRSRTTVMAGEPQLSTRSAPAAIPGPRALRTARDEHLGRLAPQALMSPQAGWVRAVREAFGMSATDLGGSCTSAFAVGLLARDSDPGRS